MESFLFSVHTFIKAKETTVWGLDFYYWVIPNPNSETLSHESVLRWKIFSFSTLIPFDYLRILNEVNGYKDRLLWKLKEKIEIFLPMQNSLWSVLLLFLVCHENSSAKKLKCMIQLRQKRFLNKTLDQAENRHKT